MLQKYIHLHYYHRTTGQVLCAKPSDDHPKITVPPQLSIFSPFVSFSFSPCLAVAHQQAATNDSKQACDTEGSVAGTF